MKQQPEILTKLPTFKGKPIRQIFTSLNSYELLENIALFIVARIYFMDYLISPFGLPLFSTLFFKNKRPYYAIFFVMSTLSLKAPEFFFKYSGAMLITMSVLLIFKEELKQKPRFVALISTASVFLTGLVYVFTEGFFAFDVLLLLLECGVLYFSFFVFSKALVSVNTAVTKNTFETMGLFSMIALTSILVFSVSITKSFWPLSHVLAIFIILLLGLTLGFGISAPSGALFGLALSFSTPYPSQMICIYSLSSLTSGLFSKYGRVASSIAFAFTSLITTLILCPEANGILTISYVAAACLLLFFVPESLFSTQVISSKIRKDAFVSEKIKQETEKSIKDTILSIESLGTIFHEIIDSFHDEKRVSRNELFKKTAEAVCSDCSLCKFCWEKDKDKTRAITDRMYSALNSKGALSKKDVPKDFSDMCIRTESFVVSLNKNYESQKVTKMWAGKLYESKRLVAEQFLNISMILDGLSESIFKKTDFVPELEQKIQKELCRHGLEAELVNVRDRDAFNVEISFSQDLPKQKEMVEDILSEVLEVPIQYEETEDGMVKFSQKPRLRADASISCMTKKNSKGSGDNASVFSVDSGRVCVVLADGMGSGEMANFESSIVIKLTKKLLKSGFNLKTCVRLINDILMTNADKDTFSTIDLCVINLHTGVAEFAKGGSQNSYLKSQNALDLVTTTSLPAGLIHSHEPDFDKKYMFKSDYLIMATDGVTDILDRDDGNDIFKALEEFSGTAEELSGEVLDLALKKSGGVPQDDMTVVAVMISENI